MPNYNLEQLGPTGFQDLAGALAVATFGAGVQKMGPGRDGGRDLYVDGDLTWKAADGSSVEIWSGYTVIQVKHATTPSIHPDDNAQWLWKEIRRELDKWANPFGDRVRVPDFMLFITNVRLSPYPTSGGHDRLSQEILRYIEKLSDDSRDVGEEAKAERELKLARLSKIKKWKFWDGVQIEALLDTNQGVRRAFPAFLTGADVFANLAEFTDRLPLSDLEPALRVHARSALVGDGQVYFDEAGSGEGKGFQVHDIATDLPITLSDGTKRKSAIGYVLGRAEHVLKPRVTLVQRPRHLIVTGTPGNGKTTLSKFLVQVYRAALLDGASDLSPGQQSVIAGTARALGRFGLRLPRQRRWAMRVDLAEYAQEGGLESDSTLLRWIALKVSNRLNAGGVSAQMLDSWMKQWPWFLVLDGLDEVTEPDTRKRLIRQVTEFVEEAEADNSDMFVLLTTRPVGYTENIAPEQFERVDLDALEITEALRYGELATRVRLHEDIDRIARITRQLEAASKDENLRNLLRTPLQVLILTIIIDGAGQVAPDRFSLFWNYYQTVFRRELSKPGGLHQLLQDNAQQILELHLRVGFELQTRSESALRSFATLSYEELRSIASDVLREDGFDPTHRDASLLENILAAAMARLVLIVPRGDEGYGFDVRSLQELTAAMFVTAGPAESVLERLRLMAPSPHWRNTWIFAAGKWFSERQPHWHEMLVGLVTTLDDASPRRLGRIVPIGPRLALDLIDDGMARSYPKWRDLLAKHAFKILEEPISNDEPLTGRAMMRFADSSDQQLSLASESIRDALQLSSVSATTTRRMQRLIATLAEEENASLRAKSLARALVRPNMQAPLLRAPDWVSFSEEIETAPLNDQQRELLEAAAESIRALAGGAEPDPSQIASLLEVLRDTEAAAALELALTHIVADAWDVTMYLRDDVLPLQARRPLGAAIRAI